MEKNRRQPEDNTLGILSLVFGILGVANMLFCSCCMGPYNVIAAVVGMVALVCGIIGHQNNQQYALAGLVLGAITVFLVVVVFVLFLLGFVFVDMLHY